MAASLTVNLKKLARSVLGSRIRQLRDVQLSARKVKRKALAVFPPFSFFKRQFRAFPKSVRLLKLPNLPESIELRKGRESAPMARLHSPTSVGPCRINFEKLKSNPSEAEFVVSGRNLQILTGEFSLTAGQSIATATSDGSLIEELSFDIFGSQNHEVLSSFFVGEITDMPGKWCVILEPQAPTYGHWLMEFVPRLLWACEQLGDKASEYRWFISGNNLPHQAWVLQKAGIPADRVVWCHGPHYLRFEHAVIPSFTSRGCLNVTTTSVERMRRALLPAASALSAPQKVYVSRKGEAFRTVTNEDDVIAVMEQRGYLIVHPRDYSLEEKVRIFSNATITVGCFSSGILHAVFMPKGSKVIEVIPKDNSSPVQWAVLDSADLFYIAVQEEDTDGEAEKQSGLRNRYSNVTIDINRLQQALEIAESS